MARSWRGVLAVEGVQTGDGRIIAEGASSWGTLPLALKPGHDSEEAVGNIATIERVGNELRATGIIDDESVKGGEIVRMLSDGSAPGGNRWFLSIEPDDVVMEVVDTNPTNDAEEEVIIVASKGRAAASDYVRPLKAMRAAAGDGDPVGEVIGQSASDDIVMRFTKLRIRAAALIPVPAIDAAYLELAPTDFAPADQPHDYADSNGDGLCDVCGLNQEEHDAKQAQINASAEVTAAATAPLRPPKAWFYEPEPDDGDERLVAQYDLDTGDYLGDAVPLYIGDDGQVYGHVAPANRCHVGYDGVCITPPTSPSGYSHFHVGYTRTVEGDDLATGPLVAGCDHAAILGLDERAARDWYANVGLAWANVRVTPGRYGPWACGALQPGISEELVYRLRGGGISGDWRGRPDALELIGVLAVNVPGFTVQRASASGGTFVASARAVMTMVGTTLRVITAPVLRSAPTNITLTASGCGCDSEELRLARENNALLRRLFAVEEVPAREKAKLASRVAARMRA